MYEQQVILSTMVVITHTFCMKNLTPRGLGACQCDPIMQVGHGEANFIFPLCNYTPEYSLVQRSVPLHRQYTQRLLVPESGITPTVSSDNQRARTT